MMIATIGPAMENCEETMSTLRYATRAKSIQNKPTVNNQNPKDTLIAAMKQQMEDLKKALANGGKTRREEEVVKEVVVWKGVKEEEVKRLKEEAEKAKQALEESTKKDEDRLRKEKVRTLVPFLKYGAINSKNVVFLPQT